MVQASTPELGCPSRQCQTTTRKSDIPVVVSVAVVVSGGEVEEGREDVEEEGGKVSEAVVDASVNDETMLDDDLPVEVVDSGAVVVGEEEAAVVVSSVPVVDVPIIVVDSEGEVVELGGSVEVALPVLVVVCSSVVVRPAVVEAGVEVEDESEVVDPAVVLAGWAIDT